MHEDLARRSIHSIKWNGIGNFFQMIVGFIQLVVLARLLPIESFGIYSGALALTTLLGGISVFGLGEALKYRCPETEDIEQTAAVHFTLQLVITLVWTVIMVAGGLIFIKSNNDGYLLVFLVLILSKAAANFASTPKAILMRSVQFKQLAIVDITTVICTLIISVVLAFMNQPLWALLTTHIVGFLVDFLILYILKPVWKPRLLWVKSTVKYFLNFGSKQLLSRLLSDSLDHIDDIWTKLYLGTVPMGFYSKAYSFALYPSKILSTPISAVAESTYAEVAGKRAKLSEAFHRTNSFLIRSGFFLVGAFMVIAPEFIRILIGERWMPMMLTFRLMLPFTLFDPMKKSMSNLFIAVGKPEINIKIRTIQMAILIAGLIGLGKNWGIEGVALAVDMMMVIGIILILHRAKSYVDYSLKSFFVFPSLALFLGLGLCFAYEQFFGKFIADLPEAIIKFLIFAIIYICVLILFDRKEIFSVFSLFKKYL